LLAVALKVNSKTPVPARIVTHGAQAREYHQPAAGHHRRNNTTVVIKKRNALLRNQ
jgi:hypothetical protein